MSNAFSRQHNTITSIISSVYIDMAVHELLSLEMAYASAYERRDNVVMAAVMEATDGSCQLLAEASHVSFAQVGFI